MGGLLGSHWFHLVSSFTFATGFVSRYHSYVFYVAPLVLLFSPDSCPLCEEFHRKVDKNRRKKDKLLRKKWEEEFLAKQRRVTLAAQLDLWMNPCPQEIYNIIIEYHTGPLKLHASGWDFWFAFRNYAWDILKYIFWLTVPLACTVPIYWAECKWRAQRVLWAIHGAI